MNLYGYVGNSPVSRIDLFGLASIKKAQGFVPFKKVQTLKVTCASSGKPVGTVAVEVGLDADPAAKNQAFLDVLVGWGLGSINPDSILLEDDYLGGFMVLRFTVTDQAELNSCCKCDADEGSGDEEPSPEKAGWIQHIKSIGSLDQEDPALSPNPFYTETPRHVMMDFAGWTYSAADTKMKRGFGDKFWDELRCARPRQGANPKLRISYPSLLLDGKQYYEWAYYMWLSGGASNPKTKGALWYNEHPRWPPMSSSVGF